MLSGGIYLVLALGAGSVGGWVERKVGRSRTVAKGATR
jgi:hypothetical protein